MSTGVSLVGKWPELRKLTARQAVDGAKRCAKEERDAGFRLLLYLTEVERKKAYEEANKRSLWPFIEETLGFTAYETRLRFYSTKALIDFPETAEYLADGRLSMTTLVLLTDVLTRSNVRDWCEKASNQSKTQVEELIAKTQSEVRDFVTMTALSATVTEVTSAASASDAPAETPAASTAIGSATLPSTPGRTYLVTNAPSKASVKALTSTQTHFEATMPNELIADLKEVSDLLSEIFPDKNAVKVIGYCLKEVKKRLQKKRGIVETKPKKAASHDSHHETVSVASSPSPEPPSPAAPDKKYELKRVKITQEDLAIAGRKRDRAFKRVAIPVETLRFVWERDNYCCQRQLKGGGICGSTYQCQIDHVDEVALGGSNDPSNLCVHCRMHNLQRARERFGTARIARAIEKRKQQTASKRASLAKKTDKPTTLFS